MKATVRWLTPRLARALIVLVGAVSAAFFAIHLAPGDPAQIVVGLSVPDPTVLAQVRHEYGFDQPLIVQFGHYWLNLLHGNLGSSYQLDEPVATLIAQQLPATLELAVAALVLALAGALLLAVPTAGRWRVLRGLASVLELVSTASPSFWVGVLLLAVFSFRLNLLPAAGGNGVAGLVLPAVTLALSMVGVFAQVLRDGMERVLGEPFVFTSRSRGTGEGAVRLRHALRHAFLPVLTLSGWAIGSLLGGAVVVETVFSRQGLGRLMATAIERRDLPVVTGLVVVAALAFTVANILVDGLYAVLDPRVREVR